MICSLHQTGLVACIRRVLFQIALNAKLQVVTICYSSQTNNYNGVFKYKTRINLKPRICYEKYCEFCTSKKNIRIIIKVELTNFY